MLKAFTCYLHKPGVLVPELRVVTCRSRDSLANAILAEVPTWGAIELIEVYSDTDEPMFRISINGMHAN